MADVSSRYTASRLRRALLTSSAFGVIAAALSGPAFANPTGGNFIDSLAGLIQGCNGSNSCVIDLLKSRAVIDWQTFDISQGDTTKFIFEQGNGSIVFNRVLKEGSTEIDGKLLGCLNTQCTAFGGNIWIYSADGIVIGQHASINTGGLLLTTSPMTTPIQTFEAAHTNQFDFGASNSTAGIDVQAGAKITGYGGTIALISQQVTTEAGSSIKMNGATGGGTASVLYGAASSYHVQFAPDTAGDFDLVDFEVPSSGGSGSKMPLNIAGSTTSAGNIYVAAIVNPARTADAIINVSGEMTAHSVSSQGGDIVLSAGGGIVNQAAGQSTGAPVNFQLSGSLAADNAVQIKTSGNVKATGSIAALNEVRIDSGGVIDDTGTIKTDTLTGSSVGGASFNGANAIKRLGDFTNTAGGNFSLSDTRSLDIAGTLENKVGDTTLRTSGDLNIDGTIDASGHTLTLRSGGAIAESSGGVISAGVLTGSSAGRADFEGLQNHIHTLTDFTSGGDFSLMDATALTITGTLKATGHKVTLDDTGGWIDAGDGAILASVLTGSAAGNADFSDQSNRIEKLDGFTADGFSLADSRSLAVTGAVDARAGNLSLDIDGDLTLKANLTTTRTASLMATGGISQQAGFIAADILTGGSGGATTLMGGNEIGTLAGFASGGDFSLTDMTTLAITGMLDATGHAVTLVDKGGDIDASRGTILAAVLTGSATGNADFSDKNNVIEDLDGFTADGFSLVDSRALKVTRDVDAGTGDLALTTLMGGLTLDANLIAGAASGSQTVSLNSAGAITQEGGTITAAILTGSSGGATTLMGDNTIGTLAGFNSGGDFSLTDTYTGTLTITGTLKATGHKVTLDDIGGGINASGAAILASVLTGSAAGNADFSDQGNAIEKLGSFSARSGFTLVDSGPLMVTGDVDAGAGDLMLTTLKGGLTLDANLTAGDAADPQGIMLNSADAITQNGGAIDAADLTLNAGGAITQNGGTMTAETILFNADGAITQSGGTINATNLTLNSGEAITQGDGTINAETLIFNAAGAITQNGGAMTAETLIFNAGGAITQNGGALDAADLILNAGGAITQNDGAISATTLTLDAGGAITQAADDDAKITAVTLTGSSGGATTLVGDNDIGTLAGFTSRGGDFSLTDMYTGKFMITGTLDATGHAVTLTDNGGSIDASGGIILADNLSGESHGDADFSNANNLIGSLGDFTTNGHDFTLVTKTLPQSALDEKHALLIKGSVDAGAGSVNITAEDGGILIINDAKTGNMEGRITGQTQVTLTAADQILMGDSDFIAGFAALKDTGVAALTVFLNNQALKSGNGAVYITTSDLALGLTGPNGLILQQNSGGGLGSASGIPGGITIDGSDPAVTISGSPEAVDLYAALSLNGTTVPFRQVASSSAIQLENGTKRSNSYRINGCVIQQTVACTVVQFNTDNVEPAKITDDLLIKASDDDDVGEDDPTITGSGNPEIWDE